MSNVFDGGATGTDEGEVECVSIPFRKNKKVRRLRLHRRRSTGV